MLKTIDVLLGLTVVMLIASMAVTVLTQFITSLRNSRGKHLARGLGDLLQQIDPQLERTVADQISHAVLTHPMICHLQGVPLLGTKLGDTIHREEFTKLLMDMASGQSFGLDKNLFPDSTKEKLKGLLKNNGIDDPAGTLDNVRAYALQLEQANPELATNVRQSIALMQEANSRFVAKINSWFDQTIDRVSDRFTASTRVVTVACSVVVVAAVQLDTIDVINRLSMDDQLRSQLVAKAIKLDKVDLNLTAAAQTQTTDKTPAAGKDNGNQPAAAPADAEKTVQQPNDKPTSVNSQSVKDDLKELETLGLINIIGSGQTSWWDHWCEVSVIGILLSVVLVSLGAPFWYGALKNLLKLRSALAGKDDQQRQERQSTQQTSQSEAGSETSSAASTLTGERGVLG